MTCAIPSMRLLLLHASRFRFEPTERLEIGEDWEGGPREFREALVVFTTVEKGDEANQEALVEKAAGEIAKQVETVKAERVVLYPYAHLSSELSDPATALEVLRALEGRLREMGLEVHRAPFGWYKAFSVEVKGHPLSELSKSIKAEGEAVPKALVAEKKAVSHWFILTPNGDLVPIEEFDFSAHKDLKAFAAYEMKKERRVTKEPAHVRLMKRHEIADYEPASDPGNLRYPPKGRLMKSLIEEYVEEELQRYGAMPSETPVMYDMGHPTLKSYLNRFPARQYVVESEGRRLFLRFAACFGQFMLLADSTITYKMLPLRLYEIAKYAFRREQRGELAGLRRLRAFTMPDMHTLARDESQAIEEFLRQTALSRKVLEALGIRRYVTALRITRDFYERHREDFVVPFARLIGEPILVEMWDERFFYFVTKFEFNYVEASGKAAALSTVQIDVENAERYGITYVDENGVRRYPVILHCSVSGAVERVIYALLEEAERRGKGMFPTWLSPTQVRLIPLRDDMLEEALAIARKLRNRGFRADVDDRDMTVQKKVREAEMEWVPYIVVYGPKERESGILPVRVREEGKIIQMGLEGLIERLERETRGFPRRPNALPILLSRRPRFSR